MSKKTDQKTKRLLDSQRVSDLVRVTSGATRPLILIYGNPDPDALASAWALQQIIRHRTSRPRIAYTGEVGRLENQAMIESLRIPASPIETSELKRADLIALVDCQPEFFAAIDLPRCDVVIDHHPRKSRRRFTFSDIRPTSLATSSILTEYLRHTEMLPNSRLATALYYGIQTDSKHLQRAPSPIDSAALRFLESRIDFDLLHRIEFSSYSLARLEFFAIALIKMRYADGCMFCHLGAVPTSDICAQIADFLIHVKEAKWALVSGIAQSRLTVVFRCDGHRKHAGKIAEEAFGSLGSAGGHRNAARAELEEDAIPKSTRLYENEAMEWFIIDRLAKSAVEFRHLRDSLPGQLPAT